WFGVGVRAGRLRDRWHARFYILFACAVTASVQLVGVYLVFATLIVPALATRRFNRWRLVSGYVLSSLAYAAGQGISLLTDLPPGPLVVCCMTALGLVVLLLSSPRPARILLRWSNFTARPSFPC